MKKLLLSSLAATLLVANDTPVYKFDAISISASPIHEQDTFDSPNQIDVIDDKQKALKATASLGGMLEDFTGVNNIATGPQAGKPVIRGMSGERVKVLSNGYSTDSQTYGIRHILNTDPFIADSIEVVRGSQSVLYGSDALGGIVNVLSPKILSTKEGESIIKGEVLGEYHTNNNERMGGVKVQTAAGKLGVNAAVSKRVADNFHTPDAETWEPGDSTDAGDKPRFSGELPFTNFDTTSALAAIGYTDDWGEVSLQHTYWQTFQNYLGVGPKPTFIAVSAAGQKLTNNETQLKAKLYLDEWTLKPSLSYTFNQREAATGAPYEDMTSKKGTPAYLNIEVKRLDGRFAVEHPMVGDFEGEIAIEMLDKEQTLLEGKLSPSATEKGMALYLFEEADYDEWVLQFGARYDMKSIYAPTDGINQTFVSSGIFDASNNDQDFSGVSGSLGATYRLTPNWNIAGNLARGFRAPSIFELYAGGIHGGVQAYQYGNPNLNAETTMGGDLSLRYKDAKTKASLTLYHNIINNYIYLARTGGTTTFNGQAYPDMQNEQTDATMQGVEFSFDTFVTDTTNIESGFEIIDGRDTSNDRKLTLMPANNLRLAVHQNVGSLGVLDNSTFSIDMKSVASQTVAGDFEPFYGFNNAPFGSADTEAYTLFGAAYSADIKIGKEKAQLGIKVTNLFDTEYRDFLDTYKGYALGMGRDVSFTLRVPFSL
jgi:iron complex outermembrane recepter protein